jgi:hypothetical protein
LSILIFVASKLTCFFFLLPFFFGGDKLIYPNGILKGEFFFFFGVRLFLSKDATDFTGEVVKFLSLAD